MVVDIDIDGIPELFSYQRAYNDKSGYRFTTLHYINDDGEVNEMLFTDEEYYDFTRFNYLPGELVDTETFMSVLKNKENGNGAFGCYCVFPNEAPAFFEIKKSSTSFSITRWDFDYQEFMATYDFVSEPIIYEEFEHGTYTSCDSMLKTFESLCNKFESQNSI